jgi:hypothetical protein
MPYLLPRDNGLIPKERLDDDLQRLITNAVRGNDPTAPERLMKALRKRGLTLKFDTRTT